MLTKRFNLRVYGICINEKYEVLLSQERYNGLSFTKFPGGGLEWGEGTTDCLKREFQEEFGLDIAVGELFYLTDFFQLSAFSDDDQVVSIYYKITLKKPFSTYTADGDKQEELIWCPMADFSADILTFPIDKYVARLLKS